MKEAVIVAACRGNHVGTIGGGKLHRQVADATGTGQDQYPLPRLQATVLQQPLPGGETRQR